MKNNSALFYTCSLIEFIGRRQKLRRSELVTLMGSSAIGRIYRYADVFHCERIEEVADRYIEDFNISVGTYNKVIEAKDNYPSYWDLGKIYMRLIRDVTKGDLIKTMIEVYNSWIVEYIENYNIAFYYMSPAYISACYREEKILD